MLFNFIVLLLVLLATAFLATQGLLSAVLAFVTASFSAILALGLFEPMQGMIESRWPGMARGVTFLLLYAVIFGITRFAADFAIPKNIKLPKLVNTIGGGVVGFFASLVIVGAGVLGLEMLPVHTTILGVGGDQEYSTDARMQGAEMGQVAPDEGLSMWPPRFTLALMHGASGRSLGGATAFGSVHPDLPLESYGYRNVVQYGSLPALPQDLLKVDGAYLTEAPDFLKKCTITDATKQALVVRIEVSKGVDTPKISCDPGDNTGKQMFRMTPTQIRMVTKGGLQHYPIGYLDKGTIFTPTTLDTGRVFDDYVNDKVIEEWVFQLDKDEKGEKGPKFVEVKQLARIPLDKVSDKPFAPLATAAYPPHEYLKNHGTISVTVTGENGPMKDVKVLLIPATIDEKKLQSSITKANSHIEDVQDKVKESVEPWASAQGKPGVPDKQAFFNAHRTTVNIANQNQLQWNEFVPVIMLGGTEADGGKNHGAMPAYYKNTLLPLMDIRATATTGADGKAVFNDVSPGGYCLVADGRSQSGTYYIWAQNVELAPKGEATAEMKPPGVYILTPMK